MTTAKYDLRHNQLRLQTFETFLEANNLNQYFTNKTHQNDWYQLTLNENEPDLDSILIKTKAILTSNLPVQKFDLAKTLKEIIEESQPHNANKTVCLMLIDNLFSTWPLRFNAATNDVLITIPSPELASLFNSLNDPKKRVNVTQQHLTFSLSAYLNECEPGLILLDKIDASPILIIHNNVIAQKEIIFLEEIQADQSIKVTPFIFVQKPKIPPVYHFIMDISSSMSQQNKNTYNKTYIDTLKQSVYSFAKILFDFDKAATISLVSFNENYTKLGIYKANELEVLSNILKDIRAKGGTRISHACSETIKEIGAVQNNIILFTDGLDESYSTDINILTNEIRSLTQEQKIRNKFFIISFETQPAIFTEMTTAFGSEIILANDAQLLQTLANHEQLQSWAAARDLFTTRLQINHTINAQISQETITQSEQIQKLGSFNVQIGDEYHLTIADGLGQELFNAGKIAGQKSDFQPTDLPRPPSPGKLSVFHDRNNLPPPPTTSANLREEEATNGFCYN